MGFISDTYGIEQTTPLATDKYHLTTAYGYWLEGRADNPAVFYMFGRKEAPGAGYTIAGGLEGVVDIVKRWQEYGFTKADLAFLRAQKTAGGAEAFPAEFISWLAGLKFRLKIDAAPEGAVFFPQEPVLRVAGPLAQVKMLESVALGLINGHSAYVTQGARQRDAVVSALQNGTPPGAASVQGMRRGPGLGAFIEASRSLGFGGYASTSTGTAAKQFGQAFAGTMDHAWIMTHEDELGGMPLKDILGLEDAALTGALRKDAFRSYAFAFPDAGIFLVDTYDVLRGLENAITVIKELRALGRGRDYGVRFDSGDIAAYSKIALRRFAEEGFVEGLAPKDVAALSDAELLKKADKCTVFCSAADGIDEYAALEMREAGAFFKFWGIGTAGAHPPPLGLVYKGSAVYMEALGGKSAPEGASLTPIMKVSRHAPVKSSNPGVINARRYYGSDGKLSCTVLYDETLGLDPEGHVVNLRDFTDHAVVPKGVCRDLLVPVFDAKGKYVLAAPRQVETFPGSKVSTTDLAAQAEKIAGELDRLPDEVRRLARPRRQALMEKLAALYDEARRTGDKVLTADIAALESRLPPEPKHLPVYLDRRLFEQRRACEQKHLSRAGAGGVAEYHERFEGNSLKERAS
jgi:nicotinate phosphoribosyltransferase